MLAKAIVYRSAAHAWNKPAAAIITPLLVRPLHKYHPELVHAMAESKAAIARPSGSFNRPGFWAHWKFSRPRMRMLVNMINI